MAAVRTDTLVGEILDGKYRIDAPLGSGGMGTVYRATHVGTGREVALKVLLAQLTAHPSAVERFRREARAAGQMRHPNVVDVTDFGFAARGDAQLAYLVMELLRGKTLRGVLEAEGKLPLPVALDVLDQVCSAVAEAHRLGILHRDLKPENILLEPHTRGYRVKVLDFGIAKLTHDGPGIPAGAPAKLASLDVDPSLAATQTGEIGTATTMPSVSGEASLTRVGAAIGTPLYMSPEQWGGGAIDARSDVYSLGVVAYEMLAGEPPFLGKERPISIEHAEVAPPPLVARAPGVPRRIAGVIEAALAKDPAARPPSAAAFTAALGAGAETTFSLLRRSVGLCVDHFGLLVRRFLPVTLPAVVMSIGDAAVHFLKLGGWIDAASARAIEAVVIAATFVVLVVAFGPVTGFLVQLVSDLVSSPRSAHPAPPLSELRRAAWRSLPSTVIWIALLLVGGVASSALSHALSLGTGPSLLIQSVLLPAFSALFMIYPAPVVMEGASGLRPLRRSLTVLLPVWPVAVGVQVFYWLLSDAIPQLLGLALDQLAARGQAAGRILDPAWTHPLLDALLGVVMTPFALVPLALLYLRAREAEGTRITALAM